MQTDTAPLISIVLPVFNENTLFLRDALESVKRQEFEEWECIIVIESTYPENFDTVNEFASRDSRFRVCEPVTRLRLAGSLNEGISRSRSNLIARMDSDDVMHKERLKRQFDFLMQNEHIDVVGSDYVRIGSNGQELGARRYPSGGFALRLYFLFRCGLAHPSVMFRRASVEEVGCYDKSLNFAEDLDLWLRMMRHGFSIANINQPLLFYRSAGARKFSHWSAMVAVRMRSFLRRMGWG